MLALCAFMCIYTRMENDNLRSNPDNIAAAQDALEVLDTKFFKALCEPVRVEIVRKLITIGACDVGTIAQGLSQDRSVVSRHLATLERAQICVSKKHGRRVLYDLDGPYIVQKVTTILDAITPMAELCIPFATLKENNKRAV